MSISNYKDFHKLVLSSSQGSEYTYNNGEFTFSGNLPFVVNNGRYVFDIESLSIESQDIVNALKVFSVPSLRKFNLLAYYPLGNKGSVSDYGLDSSGYMRNARVNIPSSGGSIFAIPTNNGSLNIVNSLSSGTNTNISHIDLSPIINTFKNNNTITVSFYFGHNTGAGRTLFSFSKDANNYMRVFLEPITTTVRFTFQVVVNGVNVIYNRTPFNTRNLGLFHAVISTSPTGNAFYVNGSLVNGYTTGDASTGFDFSSMDANFGGIGALYTSPTTISSCVAGTYKNVAILSDFATPTMVEQLDEWRLSKYANLHIRELHQIGSYHSAKRGVGDMVLTFNRENTQQHITKTTVGHILSKFVSFVRSPLTFYFTDDIGNKVTVPDGVFQVVLKLWSV
jgi:hypothetical protein